MYPGWPRTAADLKPLPQCDGPKLKPFDFQGPQKIKFIEHLGEGQHSQVFKAETLGRVYALKLFRFLYHDEWFGPVTESDLSNHEATRAFYNYSEPFSSECRAFARLQETGHEELAIRCFGYILLDEEHERTLMSQFNEILSPGFSGSGDEPCDDDEETRCRFLGPGEKPPPIRGIVKEVGKEFDQGSLRLRKWDARHILRDIKRLQQLGIINLDVSYWQMINGKFSDFSTAITFPHFMASPELNPHLTPEWISRIEYDTFRFSITDYWRFDDMILCWNFHQKGEDAKKREIDGVWAFPRGRGCYVSYNLRKTPDRERPYTLVDPRLYDWRSAANTGGNGGCEIRRKDNRGDGGMGNGEMGKQRAVKTRGVRKRLDNRPPRWYYDCDSKRAEKLKFSPSLGRRSMHWEFRDGLLFPRELVGVNSPPMF